VPASGIDRLPEPAETLVDTRQRELDRAKFGSPLPTRLSTAILAASMAIVLFFRLDSLVWIPVLGMVLLQFVILIRLPARIKVVIAPWRFAAAERRYHLYWWAAIGSPDDEKSHGVASTIAWICMVVLVLAVAYRLTAS
jgi:hypothetical protein